MEALVKRSQRILDGAGSHDLTFAMMLWALRSVLRPYVGLVHDARLYALQVANRVRGGWHADDLFFAFGSQDDYSLFSVLLTPLASWLGVAAAFACVYLAGTALLAVAEVKLVRRLVPDYSVGNLALVLLAVSELPYGGHNIFYVHEPFLTARLPAEALALWSLSGILGGRMLLGLAGLGAAMLIHPLIAVGALCVGVGLVLSARWHLSTRSLLWTGFGVVAGVMILLASPWAMENFTPMDGPWLDAVRSRSPHCFPSLWHAGDWLRIAVSLLILPAACVGIAPAGRRLAVLAVILAVGSVAVSILAEETQAAFLLQAQAYRGLWLSQWLTLPLGLLLAARLWRSPSVSIRCAAVAVVAVTGNVLFLDVLDLDAVAAAFRLWLALTIAWAVLLCGRAEQPGQPRRGRLPETIAAGLLSTAVLLSATNFVVNLSTNWHRPVDRVQLLSLAVGSCSALVLTAAGIIALGALQRLDRCFIRIHDSIDRRAGGEIQNPLFVLHSALRTPHSALRRPTPPARHDAGWMAAGIAVLAGAGVFFLQRSDGYRDRFEPGHADVAFVSQVIGSRTAARPAEVYWAVAEPELLWLDLRANCYYDFAQVAGIIFSRETALAGRQRALLAGPFEVASRRRFGEPPDAAMQRSVFSGGPSTQGEPTRANLLRLAADPALDWIVLDQSFKGLTAATNGSVSVYDCHRLRSGHRQ